MTLYTATNAATFQTALADAVGGDRIELAGGSYAAVTITNVYNSEVVVTAADPASPPAFSNLQVSGAVNVTFDWLWFKGDGTSLPFTVTDCAGIKFTNSTFAGTLPSGYGFGKGLQISRSSYITVENCEFFHWMKAFAVGSSNTIVVRANNMHHCNNDAINFTAVNGLIIEGNWIHDFLTTPGQGHNDMIQCWNPDRNNPAQNVTISGNFLDAGTGDRTQTIFMGNGKAAKEPNNLALYFRNFLIADNVIFNAHSHGISTGETIGLTIIDNTLLRNRWVNGSTYHAPQIRRSPTDQQVVVAGNILHKDVGGSQFVVQDDNPNGDNYYGDVFVNALAEGAALADLRAVSGGLIEAGGWGARMTRENITLNVGPGALPMPDPNPVPDPIPEPDPIPDPTPEPDPVPEPDPEPDPTPDLEAMQAQIDGVVGELSVLSDAHNALVMAHNEVVMDLDTLTAIHVNAEARLTMLEDKVAAGAAALA